MQCIFCTPHYASGILLLKTFLKGKPLQTDIWIFSCCPFSLKRVIFLLRKCWIFSCCPFASLQSLFQALSLSESLPIMGWLNFEILLGPLFFSSCDLNISAKVEKKCSPGNHLPANLHNFVTWGWLALFVRTKKEEIFWQHCDSDGFAILLFDSFNNRLSFYISL